MTPVALVLLLGGGVGIAIGQGSGLEYLVWPRGLSAAPLALLAVLAWGAWRRLDALCPASAEGAWLLVMGILLLRHARDPRIDAVDVEDRVAA